MLRTRVRSGSEEELAVTATPSSCLKLAFGLLLLARCAFRRSRFMFF